MNQMPEITVPVIRKRTDKERKQIYVSRQSWDRLVALVGPRQCSQTIEDLIEGLCNANEKSASSAE